MKKSTYLTILIGICLSGPVHADFIIHLKNHRKIEAQKHWEKNNQLMIKTPRGTIGIPLRNVVKIEKIANKRHQKQEYFKSTSPAAPSGGSGGPLAKKSNDMPEFAKPLPKVKKKDYDINRSFSDIKGMQRNLDGMDNKQMVAYVKKIDDLMHDIHSKRLNTNYADELKSLHDFRSKAEAKYYKKSKK